VGAHPTREVRRLATPGRIEVTGHVQDVRTFLQQATVVVIPLRIGGGTRLKLLEALAMGKTIVSTTLGAEGIVAKTDQEILLADDAQRFADQIQKVLTDTALRARLGKAARALVEDRYSWETSVGRLNQVYGECLAQPRNSWTTVGIEQS
jgi:glycosyltransferase involved in cell wall biosynthesis